MRENVAFCATLASSNAHLLNLSLAFPLLSIFHYSLLVLQVIKLFPTLGRKEAADPIPFHFVVTCYQNLRIFFIPPISSPKTWDQPNLFILDRPVFSTSFPFSIFVCGCSCWFLSIILTIMLFIWIFSPNFHYMGTCKICLSLIRSSCWKAFIDSRTNCREQLCGGEEDVGREGSNPRHRHAIEDATASHDLCIPSSWYLWCLWLYKHCWAH